VDRRVAGAGHRIARARQLEGELAQPVLPRDEHQDQRPEDAHVCLRGARGRHRRRLRADPAGRGVRGEGGGQRDRRGQQQPLGDPLVQRQREDEEADVLVKQGIGHAEVGPVQPQHDVLPVRAHRAAGDDESHACADRQLHDQQDAAQADPGATARQPPVGGGGPLDDPQIAEQEGRRPDSGEPTRDPPGREQRPEHALLPELVEPQPLGLEVCRDPRGQGQDREHAEQQRGAHARSQPPTTTLPRCATCSALLAPAPRGRGGARD